MRKILSYITGIIIFIMALSLFLDSYVFALTNSSFYTKRTIVLSKTDLRKYFEKAMSLFETGKYKEAIAVFENLIEIEKSQNESYFTPFAEIYIDKSKGRMREMLLVEDRRWKRMKREVIDEAERIAKEEADKIARQERERVLRKVEMERKAEELKRKALEEAERKIEADKIARQEQERVLREVEMERKARKEAEGEKAQELVKLVRDTYEEALRYYREQNYPMAITEFKKIKELDPKNRLVSQAEAYIAKAQGSIKKKEERGLLARMEAARLARIEMEREEKRRQIEEERKERGRQIKEREKQRMRIAFEERLKAIKARDRIRRLEGLMDTIRKHVSEQRFEEAEVVLNEAIAEFPDNKRFKDISHYVNMQELKVEEEALKREREIIEEKMLLEVARKHMMPEEKEEGVLKREKKITPLVRVPEIRKRLKIPISVDFKDVELDYVLSFLSDATGVNIIASSAIDSTKKKVSIKIKDMPLEDALRYILKSQDLVYRIEEDAVWVATGEELDDENVETRVYFLNQGIGRFAEFMGTYGGAEGDSGSTEVKTVKDILENSVDWPKDSKLTLDERTGALIITNIPSNIEIIENLLYNLDVTPVQVLIEAKFLEVTVSDVDEFGIEWKLNSAWGLSQNSAKQNLHGFASNSGVDFSDFTRSSEGFNLTYQGILSHPQFQAVIHALKEKQNVKTLSAPTITTLNNQTATIEVIDEFIYPTRYEVSLVQFDINGDGDYDDAGETEWANIPQDFVTRDVGILLHVKPSVGVDNKTITLALTPEVSESSTSFTYAGEVSIPKFETRNLSTSVIVESGGTIVLGGLIKETNTNIKTKVPFLGDLPFLGGLFRKNTENVERKNLLIFVTASVLNNEENIVASATGNEKIRREQ